VPKTARKESSVVAVRSIVLCGMAAALLGLGGGSAGAYELGQPADIYTARVIVTGTDMRERPKGMRECLEDVLAKASGDMNVIKDPRVAELGKNVGPLLDRYSYIDRMEGYPVHDEQGSHDRPYYLTCEFKQDKIDGILATLGRKPWPGDRVPLTLILAVRAWGKKNVLSSDGDFDPDMRTALLNSAMRMGLTVTLPSADALNTYHVTTDDLAQMPATQLAPVAARSGGTVPLVGSLDWSDADHGYIAVWTLTDAKGQAHRWSVKGVTYDEAFRNAVRGAAQILSGHGEP
jgi:hypothetical protein